VAPYTYAQPLGTAAGNFAFSNTTGQLSFLPNSTQNSLVVSKVTETRNGVVVGTSMREMVFVVLSNCNNQSPGGAISGNVGLSNTGNEITICNSTSNLQFDINIADPDNGKVTVNFSGLPTGATMTLSNNNTPNPLLHFNWNIPSGAALGDYTFYVTYQDDGCPLSSKQTIAYTIHYIQPVSAILNTTAETCVPANDGTLNVIASSINGGFDYAINGNSFQNNAVFTNLSAGIYTVTVKDSENCLYTTSVEVQAPAYPVIENVKSEDIRCNGGTDGSLEVFVSPLNNTYTYLLLPNNIVSNNPLFSNLLENNYTIVVSDINGCKDTATASIAEPNKLTFENIEISPLTCDKINGKIKISTNFNSHIYYKLIPTSNAVDTLGIFTGLNAGNYTIVARNENDCLIDTAVNVGIIPRDFFSTASGKDLPCWGKGDEGEAEVMLSGGVPPISVLWSSTPPQTTTLASKLTYGYYFVHAIDATGCELHDTVYIAPGTCCENVFLPTAFSPNGDGNNDEWKMISSTGMEIEQFAIFDRWGQKVWYSRYADGSWDGKINQGVAELGTYFYLLRYKCLSDGKHYTKTGDFILVR
jgi:gliding motility-associated-like protein